jgi:UDP:flavonoid glycosyltransferase YjiC (YdhE family)
MTSIVVATPPFTGEMQPLLQIAAGLASRGHDVTMLTGSRFQQQVRAAGVGFIALQGDADFDDRRLAEHRPAIADAAPGPDQLNALFGAAADALPTEHRQVQALLDADPDAVLITNSVLLGPWAVALGAPGRRPRRWIAVGCNPLALPSEDTTPLGPVPAGPDGDARAANRAVNAQFAEMTEPARARIESALRSLGATDPVPGIFDGVVTVPEVFASLTVPGLEFARGDAPSSLHLIGVLPAPVPAGWQQPSWWAELDGRTVVAVTQGTLSNGDLGALVQPTLDALAGEDLLVVAALGRDVDGLPGPVPANARVEPFVPFGLLLPHVDVFVTNGGFGATQQALAAGVPVVVAGDTDDKPLVAARIAARQIGRNLQTGTPQPGQIREAVFGLLTDDAVHQNVAHLAQEYARHDPILTIESLMSEP